MGRGEEIKETKKGGTEREREREKERRREREREAGSRSGPPNPRVWSTSI